MTSSDSSKFSAFHKTFPDLFSFFNNKIKECFILKFTFINNHKRYKKVKSFETSLIRLIGMLLVVLIFLGIFLYYASIKSIYTDQLEKSNDSIIEQVVISFESVMKQITDNIYKTPLYDTELIDLIKQDREDIIYRVELQRKLDSIIIGNEYLYSSYLYLPSNDRVYSTEYANSYLLDKFSDKQAIVKTKNGAISILDPRLVNTAFGRKLFISVVCPVPLYQGEYKGLLVVNIDANKLYYDILKKIKTDENMNFFVYSKDNTMIINKDETLLFKKTNPVKSDRYSNSTLSLIKNLKPFGGNKLITSTYYSQVLNWNFVLETRINSTSTFITRLYSIVFIFIGLLILSLLILILIIKHSTKPMKKALSRYNEKLWVDYLTDNNVASDDSANQIAPGNIRFSHPDYAVFLTQYLKTDITHAVFEQYLMDINRFISTISAELTIHAITINKNQIALLLNLDTKNEPEKFEIKLLDNAQHLYESFAPQIRSSVYISISTVKENFTLVPIAYRECSEALNYKISGNSHIIRYSNIKSLVQNAAYEYPYALEKQIINNLIVGNPEACRLFLDKFFKQLSDLDFCLSDSDMKTYIYQLQTSIMKNISRLPIQVKIDSSLNLLSLYNLDEIKQNILDFTLKIASEISKTGEDEEMNIINGIFEYIENKYANDDFNLNSVADELNMNRNYLAKVIKEKTGDSFNDYISKKRIEMAKTLLDDKSLPIEHIARRVGFNYSNYFIRVFKSFEGITPGQYRANIIEEAGSPE